VPSTAPLLYAKSLLSQDYPSLTYKGLYPGLTRDQTSNITEFFSVLAEVELKFDMMNSPVAYGVVQGSIRQH